MPVSMASPLSPARFALLMVLAGIVLSGCGTTPPAVPTASPVATDIPISAPLPQEPSPLPRPAPSADPVTPTTAPIEPTVEPEATPVRLLQLEEPPMSGDDVQALQEMLLQLGYAEVGRADGIFGTQTDAAVRRFQRLNGLPVDGIAGPDTLAALSRTTAQRGDRAGGGVPIAIALDAGFSGWLIGGGGEPGWFGAAEVATSIVTDTRYILYSLNGVVGEVTGGQAVNASDDEPCADLYTVELRPAATPRELRPIAVQAPWNPLPRQPQLIDPADPAYYQLVSEWLVAQGVAPNVQIESIVSVDLEGDGENEVLISATRHLPVEGGVPIYPAAGDYSFVLLLKVVDGTLKPIPLIEEYFPDTDEQTIKLTNRLLAILDLNGDGHLEMVIASDYYEGASTLVFELQGQQVTKVLAVGCGA